MTIVRHKSPSMLASFGRSFENRKVLNALHRRVDDDSDNAGTVNRRFTSDSLVIEVSEWKTEKIETNVKAYDVRKVTIVRYHLDRSSRAGGWEIRKL